MNNYDLRKIIKLLFISSLIVIILACDNDTLNDHNNDLEKVKLRIYIASDIDNHRVGNFRFPIVDKLKSFLNSTFPEYEFEYIFENQDNILDKIFFGEREVLSEILNNNESRPPDIIIDYMYSIPHYFDMELIGFDFIELADLHGINIHTIEDAFIEQLRDPLNGEVHALPLTRSLHAMLYQKEHGDESEMPVHPTWEEVIRLNMRLDTNGLSLLHQQNLNYRQLSTYEDIKKDTWEMSLPVLDKATQQGSPVFRMSYNEPTDNYALLSTYSGNVFPPEVDWDIVAYPTFNGKNDYGPDAVIDIITVSKHTDHLEQSLEVINALLSYEFQDEMSRIGHGSPLNIKEIHQSFGEDVFLYQDKNMDAFFQNKVSNSAIYQIDELDANTLAYKHVFNILDGNEIEPELVEMLRELKDFFGH